MEAHRAQPVTRDERGTGCGQITKETRMLTRSDDRDNDGRICETDPLEELTNPRCSMLLRLDLDLSRGTRSIPMACKLVRTVYQRVLDDDARADEIERAFRKS